MFEKIDNNEEFSGFDILFTDLLMAVISGQEVVKYMRRTNKKCCIAVVSSNIQITEKELCFENGADYFIEKPLTIEKLQKFKEFYDSRI